MVYDLLADCLFDRYLLFTLFQNPKIPEPLRMTIVGHTVHVHCSTRDYTQDFLLKLRRKNYVTPRHYLDFIHMYLKLLDEKNNYISAQVKEVLTLTKACVSTSLHMIYTEMLDFTVSLMKI